MWRFFYTIARCLDVLPGMLERMHRLSDGESGASEEERYDYVRYVTGVMQKRGHIQTERFGVENLPEEGGYVMYPNHQGKYDAYGIIGAHDKPLSFVMDKEKSYGIFIHEIVETLRGKRLEKDNNRQGLRVINQVAEDVKAGQRYILFPEGGYEENQRNRLGEFKAGCFKISLKSQTPIVPVVLVDSYKVFNSWQLTPVKTQVHFLRPIAYQEYKDLKTNQIAALVKERIQERLDQVEQGKVPANC